MNWSITFYTWVYEILCMFGMNTSDVLVGYVHRRRKSDLGRLYISRASTHASLRIFLITKACLYKKKYSFMCCRRMT